ncbi:MAG: restriction endonuclease subunit S [Syntrophales bacterium]
MSPQISSNGTAVTDKQMLGDWKETTLGTLIDFSNGRSSPDRIDSGKFFVYGSNGIIGKSDLANTPENTIVIGRVGSYCGSLYFSNSPCWVTDNAIKANPKDDNDPKYLFLLLQTLHLNKRAGGSGQPLINQATLNAIEVRCPVPALQRRIAAILGCLDDKIDLLQKQNQTLEIIAQTLFKRWFVDFNFSNVDGKPYHENGGKMVEGEFGEAPEGWRQMGLSGIAKFLNGLAMQKFPQNSHEYLPVIKIRELNSGISDQTDKVGLSVPEEYVVQNGDILFSWSGSLELVIWNGGKGALNQHLFKVTSDEYPKWFYYFWIKHHLPNFRVIASGKATTMGHIQRHHLDEAIVNIPNQKILELSNTVFEPIFNKWNLNHLQIQSLAKLRDMLLPRLMTGNLSILTQTDHAQR